jgi:hypothetical protein
MSDESRFGAVARQVAVGDAGVVRFARVSSSRSAAEVAALDLFDLEPIRCARLGAAGHFGSGQGGKTFTVLAKNLDDAMDAVDALTAAGAHGVSPVVAVPAAAMVVPLSQPQLSDTVRRLYELLGICVADVLLADGSRRSAYAGAAADLGLAPRAVVRVPLGPVTLSDFYAGPALPPAEAVVAQMFGVRFVCVVAPTGGPPLDGAPSHFMVQTAFLADVIDRLGLAV